MSSSEPATLLRLLLSVRSSGQVDSELRSLLDRYQADDTFHDEVLRVADGLGLELLQIGHGELRLSAQPSSPFAPRLEDYPLAVRSAAERICHGLIHVTIAAMAYPGESDLEDQARVVRLSVHEVDEHLWQLSSARSEAAPGAADAPDGDLSMIPVWAIWRRQKRAAQTADGRASSRTTRRWVEVAFEWLAEHGLAQRVSEAGGGTYRLTRAHRAFVREVTSQRLIALVEQPEES